jgi:hypothetical protein
MNLNLVLLGLALIIFSVSLVPAYEDYYRLHMPTKWEVKELAMDSHISGRAWSEDYDCTEFSNDLIYYLKQKGIFSCATEINFLDGESHVIVAVQLYDERIVYVEPQSAEVIESRYLGIGDDYCKRFNMNCSWNVTKISSCYGVET